MKIMTNLSGALHFLHHYEKNIAPDTIQWLNIDVHYLNMKMEEKFARDTIQCQKNVVHYLNMKMPYILVDIIDLQFCIKLKWYGM